MKKRILVVDGDATRRDTLRRCLQSNGFDVGVLYEPARGVARVAEERSALVVLSSGPSFRDSLAVLLRICRVLKWAARDSLRQPVVRALFRFNGFELNFASRSLTFRGKAVPLTETEYSMLNLFTTAPGRIFSREAIAQRMLPDGEASPASVSIRIHRLLRRIERDASSPELIRTVRATGYVFRPDRIEQGSGMPQGSHAARSRPESGTSGSVPAGH
ncbi:response regulator transcription factor [Burkholderia pyrrocinia]|uniref:response regulator transcription factor n=1 Tax=Burkholderia pyrrocinia TaxID=60550 RepID=UPI002AB09825|nr:response regulator transcription factor [Burkholderia pyrrocinia]